MGFKDQISSKSELSHMLQRQSEGSATWILEKTKDTKNQVIIVQSCLNPPKYPALFMGFPRFEWDESDRYCNTSKLDQENG